MPKLTHPHTGDTVFATNAGAEVLRSRGYTDAGTSASSPDDAGAKTIDEMSGKELDAFAAELKLDDWNPKAKVPDKKAAIHAAVAAKLAAAMADGLDDLTDDELKAKAAELNLDTDADADRETLLAAIRAAQ